MKRTMSIIALSTVLTTAAYANTGNLQIEAERFVEGADVSLLTEQEQLLLSNAIHSGDSSGERQRQVFNILSEAGAIVDSDSVEMSAAAMSDNEITQLQIEVSRYGDFDVETLSEEEMLRARTIIFGGGSNSEKSAQIRALFG